MDLSKLIVMYDGQPLSSMRLTLIDTTTGEPHCLATEAILHISATTSGPEVVGLATFQRDSAGKLVRDLTTFPPKMLVLRFGLLKRNPLLADDYRAKLAAMPEPSRSHLLDGALAENGGED